MIRGKESRGSSGAVGPDTCLFTLTESSLLPNITSDKEKDKFYKRGSEKRKMTLSSTYPPFAIKECVPMITLFTLGMMVPIWHSVIRVVSILAEARFLAISWPLFEKKKKLFKIYAPYWQMVRCIEYFFKKLNAVKLPNDYSPQTWSCILYLFSLSCFPNSSLWIYMNVCIYITK